MTDHELKNLAVAALRRTTVSYPEWERRVAAGKYNPRDGSLTEWGKAFAYLSQIKDDPAEPSEPRGPFAVRDGRGTVQAFPDCFFHTADAATIRNKHVKNVTGYGVGTQQYWPPTVLNPGRTTIEDVIVEGVGQDGRMGGRGEFGAWLGNPTDLRRFVIRDCAWGAVNIVARSQGSVIEGGLIERVPVGLYFEHATHDVIVRNVRTREIEPRAVLGGNEPNGVLAARSGTKEYWYPNADFGGMTGPYNITYQGMDIYCPPPNRVFGDNDPTAGDYNGPGCYGMRYLGCRFFGPGVAVRLPTVRANGGADAVFDGCVFENDGPRVVYHSLPMGT